MYQEILTIVFNNTANPELGGENGQEMARDSESGSDGVQ